MAIRKRKPTSPGRRFQTSPDFSDLTTDSPEKSLLAKQHGTGGRNNTVSTRPSTKRAVVTLSEGEIDLYGN